MMASTPNPSVAVIGGGVSGLVCAIRLGQLGFSKVTVFDTGACILAVYISIFLLGRMNRGTIFTFTVCILLNFY